MLIIIFLNTPERIHNYNPLIYIKAGPLTMVQILMYLFNNLIKIRLKKVKLYI